MLDLILPDWPAPSCVKALATTRGGGVSQPPFDSLNLGDHVEDNLKYVSENRALLAQQLSLPSSPLWLSQCHGTHVIEPQHWQPGITADGITSRSEDQVCAVLTADCLPILLCQQDGQQVAAVHAGWRGLAAGIIEQAVAQFERPQTLLAWLGPAIGPQHFEVGQDVFDAFYNHDQQAKVAFKAGRPGHYFADLYLLARQHLHALGIEQIYGGDFCTFEDEARFFSYRRDGKTGRMASLIWIDNSDQ